MPILQNISPGELQNAEHALDCARDLVAEWLATYKFKNWNVHSSTGQPVTPEDRKQRAKEIADQLKDQSHWKTHGRSLKIEDLRQMRLQVTDYSEQAELADAITRYYTLLQMTFGSNVYKIFETPKSQIMRIEVVPAQTVFGPGGPFPALIAKPNSVEAQVACKKCGTAFIVQVKLDPRAASKPGAVQLPPNNLVKCLGPNCSEVHNLTALRAQTEALTMRPTAGNEGANN